MIHSAWGIIIASGKGEQLPPDIDIAFLNSGDDPILSYSMRAFEQCPEIDGVVVVVKKERKDDVRGFAQMFGCSKVTKVAVGTTQRLSSVQAGIKALNGDASIVVVHEVSRPCVKAELIGETVKAAKRYGSGVAATRVLGTVKQALKGQKSMNTIENNTLWFVQTPQAFKIELLDKALDAAAKKKINITDETAAYDLLKKETHLVPSPPTNIKIATPGDLSLASALLRMR